MTFTLNGLRTVVVAGTIALGAVTAQAQTAAPPVHDHGSTPADQAAPMDKMMWSITSLDKRIAQLAADMKMFTGELKIQTMAALLEALVERQTLIEAEMKQMHEHMSGPMNERRRHAPPPSELEPETLCSPFI
jgi:TolA-binding protein